MMSGTGIFKTFKNITLKLALPGVLALMLLIFIRAFESFEVPALVGRPGNIRLLTTEIYQSIAKSLPPNYGQAGAFSVALLVFVTLTSIGVPGTNGFIGEFLVLLGSFRTYPVMSLIATTVVIIAAAYLLWAIQRIIFNPLDKPVNEHIPDLNRRELLVMVPLVAAMLWLGVYPAPVLRRMQPAAEQFVRTVQERSALSTASVSEGR